MKKALFPILVLLFFGQAAQCQSVSGTTAYGLVYKAENGQITISHYDGGGAVVIPATIKVSGTDLPVTSIGDKAFWWCTELRSVSIPPSVVSIGNSAFTDCWSLADVTIPAHLTSIGSYAFCECPCLTSVRIPASVSSIGKNAFANCASLRAIEVDPANPNYGSWDGVFFDKAQTVLLQYPASKPGATYNIPESVVEIGDSAFLGAHGLTDVEIPDGLAKIGEWAFDSCSGLRSIRIPKSLGLIAEGAFCFCHGLREVEIPEGVTEIARVAFYDCRGLLGVRIASSVSKIGKDAFTNCENLGYAIFMGNAPSMDTDFEWVACDFAFYNFDGAAGFSSRMVPTSDGIGYPAINLGNKDLGLVRVLIKPAGAIRAGARWRVDGGPWNKSGAIVGNLSAGSHHVEFRAVRGRPRPPTEFFMVNDNSVVTLSGTYQAGLAASFTGMLEDGGGLVELALTQKGRFTGKLLLRGKTYRLNGAFDASGNYLQLIGNPPIRLELHTDPAQIGAESSELPITGSVGGLAFVAYPAAFNRDQPAEGVGRYTLLLSPGEVRIPAPSQAPTGTGYARMKVSSTGLVTISGKLADNTSFSASCPIVTGTNGKQFYLYNPGIYGGKGLLAGNGTFETLAGSDCDGTLQWFKPWQKSGHYFKTGIDMDLRLAGAHYVKPRPGEGALPISSGALTLSGGSIAYPISEPVNLLPDNTIAAQVAYVKNLQASINPATGLLRGSFLHPATNQKVSFQGAIYQNPNMPGAAGFFLGPILSGTGFSGNVRLTR